MHQTDELEVAVEALNNAIRIGTQTGQWDEVRLAALALAHYSLGFPLVAEGKFAEAQATFQTAIDGATPSLGANHPLIISARSGLASALSEDGKLAEAEAEFRTAIASSLEAHPADSPAVAVVRGSAFSAISPAPVGTFGTSERPTM